MGQLERLYFSWGGSADLKKNINVNELNQSYSCLRKKKHANQVHWLNEFFEQNKTIKEKLKKNKIKIKMQMIVTKTKTWSLVLEVNCLLE